MALTQGKLKDALVAMPTTDNELVAINNWADAYTTYFSFANAQFPPIPPGVPVTPPATQTLEPMRLAMVGGMGGLSEPYAAALAIQTGITLFWSSMAPPAVSPLVFAGSTAIAPPTGLSGIAASLTTQFPLNVGLPLETAMNNIAGIIHNACTAVPGLATYPTTPSPTQYPIL